MAAGDKRVSAGLRSRKPVAINANGSAGNSCWRSLSGIRGGRCRSTGGICLALDERTCATGSDASCQR
jgi:hypothetical protein